jgi:hypothetical protein
MRLAEGWKLTTAAVGLLDVLSFFDVDAGFLACSGGDCRCSHSFLKNLVSIKTFRGKAEEGKWDGLGCTLICRAIVKKACSTFVAFLAEVSRKGMPRPSANSYH